MDIDESTRELKDAMEIDYEFNEDDYVKSISVVPNINMSKSETILVNNVPTQVITISDDIAGYIQHILKDYVSLHGQKDFRDEIEYHKKGIRELTQNDLFNIFKYFYGKDAEIMTIAVMQDPNALKDVLGEMNAMNWTTQEEKKHAMKLEKEEQEKIKKHIQQLENQIPIEIQKKEIDIPQQINLPLTKEEINEVLFPKISEIDKDENIHITRLAPYKKFKDIPFSIALDIIENLDLYNVKISNKDLYSPDASYYLLLNAFKDRKWTNNEASPVISQILNEQILKEHIDEIVEERIAKIKPKQNPVVEGVKKVYNYLTGYDIDKYKNKDFYTMEEINEIWRVIQPYKAKLKPEELVSNVAPVLLLRNSFLYLKWTPEEAIKAANIFIRIPDIEKLMNANIEAMRKERSPKS